MEFWNWETFWNEFSPSVLVASVVLSGLMSGLVMIAVWAWKHSRQILFGIVLWATVFILLAFSLSVLKLNRPIESPRPYFTQSQASVSPNSRDNDARSPFTTLIVSVQNNERPAKNFISQLLLFDEQLDPTIEPLGSGRVKNANDIGRSQRINHRIAGNFRLRTRSAFIVFEIRLCKPPI